ncbi:MAG TPA: hypothetical protein VF469_31140 [Kofleriaceae bacterium]
MAVAERAGRPVQYLASPKVRKDELAREIYDKQGTVLRAETTTNDRGGFKVYRTAEGDDAGQPTWRAMRKGVADMTRRTEVS